METISDIIKRSKIDLTSDISEPPTYCLIGDRPSLTAGNFSLINGKKKAGKTFLLGGIIASTINNTIQLDSIKGRLPEDKKVVIYFDTEQSPFHVMRSVKRICALSGIPIPGNFYAYGLRPWTPRERLEVIDAVISTTPNIGLIAIDGIRDLLSKGINDEQEATYLTSLLLKWSFDYNIHIVTLLHQNKNDMNARGHIGTEVVNKAETIITVTKESKYNIFKVSCEDSRDVPFEDFGFTISEQGLPVPCELLGSKPKKLNDPKLTSDQKHFELLNELYKGQTEYTYNELKTCIMDSLNIGRDASEKFISYYLDKTWLIKEQRGKCSYHKLNMLTFGVCSN